MPTLPELLALDDAALLDRVCAFTAAERSALWRPAERALEQYSWRDAFDGRHERYTPEQGRKLDLIVMATAPVDRLYHWPREDQLRIARSRGSRFLHALARHMLHLLATDSLGSGRFGEIRQAELDGLIKLTPDDDYVLAMVSAMGGRNSEGPSRADLLRADPDLLERAFWRIFEIEGTRQVSLANIDNLTDGPTQTWREAVLDLLADATIDRARVLDATVAALGLGFPQFRAGWFGRLHAALAPTVDERAARQTGYVRLLRSNVGPTVGLAIDVLTALHKAGRLDDADVGDGLAAAVLAPAKSTALKALRLAARVPAGVAALTVALGHPHPDVQAAAVREFRVRGEPGPVRAALPALAPAVAAEARDWLGEQTPTPAEVVWVPASEDRSPVPDPIVPITESAELAEAFAVLLADPSDAELLERALCGAARLGPDPDEYGGLARRAARLLRAGPAHEWEMLLDVVAGVVLAAANERPVRQLPPMARPLGLLVGRAAAVESALRAGRRFAPYAEPTHAGGWIAPATLVARLAAGVQPDPLDAVAALLRLGPDPANVPPEVREAAAAVPGALGAALRYALGGEVPAQLTRADRPLWIAAARSRSPRADDAPLIRRGPGYDAAGAGRALRWWVEVGAGPPYARLLLRTEVPPAPPAPPDPALPTVALGAMSFAFERLIGAVWHPWLASMWPGNIEPVLALALRIQFAAVADAGDGGTAGAHVLDLLTRTVAELPPLAGYSVATGLAGATVGDRTAAVDAAAALLPRRLSPESVASAMATLAPAVPLNRWATSLAELAAAGRPAEVRAILTALLPSLDRTRRGVHTLVELLRDEHLRAGVGVEAAGLRQWLAAATGGSRTAVAARGLLAGVAKS